MTLAGLLPALSPLPGAYATEGLSPEETIEDALGRLSELREEIAAEKIPLSQRLNTLETEVLDLRREDERKQRLRDSGGLDINSLEADIKAREEEIDYIAGLVTEYLSGLETRADPSELALYRDELDRALASIDNPSLSLEEQFARQMEGIEFGLDRLEGLSGGTGIDGSIIAGDGDLVEGRFILYGPTTFFSDAAGNSGIALRGDTDVPVLVEAGPYGPDVAAFASAGSGRLPLDPTLGKAIAMASTEESLVEHILKGGVWIYPILFAAGLSLGIAFFKFFELFWIRTVPPSGIRELVDLVREGKQKEALAEARELPEPASGMLVAGISNAGESKELLEEILLEKIVEAQPKVDRLLPVIAVTAATAPLLGLLGTVTGMINTFKLITLFGTGDAKSLSSGISEALITTEFGLIVAIPSLILHAILSRKAKAIMSALEGNAMSFVNGVSARRQTGEAA